MHQRERVYIQTMTSLALGLSRGDGSMISLSTPAGANETIGIIDFAITRISKQRADLGAYYNRLEHAAKGLFNSYENLQASESRIRDADMAEEAVMLSKNQILVQSGTAMLAQANLRPQSILQLLR